MFQNITEEEKLESVSENTRECRKNKLKTSNKKIIHSAKYTSIYNITNAISGKYCKRNGAICTGNICRSTLKWASSRNSFHIHINRYNYWNGEFTEHSHTFLQHSYLFGMVLIFKPWYEEEYKSERRKLGKYVFASVIIVQALQIWFKGFLLYDLFLGITTGIITYIFYKIFSNSLIVISEYRITKVFTVEEVVGASLIIAIATMAFGNFQILGFEIKTVLCILIVLILGWKKGILIGATSGITIGAVLGVIGGRNANNDCFICTFAE